MSDTAVLFIAPWQVFNWTCLLTPGSASTYILIDAGVFLRHGFVPDDVTCGEAQNHVNVPRALRTLIHVVA